MITEQLIWFIDCRSYFQTTSLDKLVHLIPPHQRPIKIIIDASSQLQGRGYWHLFSDKSALSEDLMSNIEAKKSQLIKFFRMNAIDAEVVINKSSDYLNVLNAEVKSNSNSLVVIEDNEIAKRHSIFQRLTDIKAPVLLLKKKAWKSPMSILAAVDPLHEYAKSGKIDDDIISLSEQFSSLLMANLKMAHCCNLTWASSKYKNKILTMHRDGLNRLAKSRRIPLSKCILLEGAPENALSSYIDDHDINMMVMGLVARNKLEQLWVGSTTIALLTDLPCDLLLVKE